MLYLSANSENVIYTEVSANKTLSNPTYLMSMTHAQTGKNWTFIPQNVSSYSGAPYNDRYDIFKFNISGGTQDLTGGTRAWYFQSTPAYVYDDQRYRGTGKSYPKMALWTPTLNFFYVQFDWTDTNDSMDNAADTGFTVTVNDQIPTASTVVFRQSRGGGVDEGRIALNAGNSPVPLADIYKISYTGTSTGGTSMTGTVYVPNGITVENVKPWQYYGDADYDPYRSYPITHLNTPVINIDEIGEFAYSIREQSNPVNLDPSLSMEKLEVGLAYITEGFTDTFYNNSETSTVYNPD